MSEPRIIIALEYPDAASALAVVEQLDPAWCRLKVGKELFTAAGPHLLDALMRRGFSIFLDLKFHDIPNTVAQACKAAAQWGVWMVNVHALGGRAMLETTVSALAGLPNRPLLTAVTVLTSMDAAQLAELGLPAPAQLVPQLAQLAKQSGVDGVVCSALEASALRAALGPDFKLVTPGIRPDGSSADDQQRIMTPVAARMAGADYLVIGRPVTRSSDPRASLQAIHQQLMGAV